MFHAHNSHLGTLSIQILSQRALGEAVSDISPFLISYALCLLVLILLFSMWNRIKSWKGSIPGCIWLGHRLATWPGPSWPSFIFLSIKWGTGCSKTPYLGPRTFRVFWAGFCSLCTLEMMKTIDMDARVPFSGKRAHRCPHILKTSHLSSATWPAQEFPTATVQVEGGYVWSVRWMRGSYLTGIPHSVLMEPMEALHDAIVSPPSHYPILKSPV